jgi:RNA polymerase subunit RPABC4/transcription elongation factor Spt4
MPAQTKRCPHCGKIIGASTRKCSYCKRPVDPVTLPDQPTTSPPDVPETKPCSSCRSPLPPEAAFCPKCGTQVEAAQLPLNQPANAQAGDSSPKPKELVPHTMPGGSAKRRCPQCQKIILASSSNCPYCKSQIPPPSPEELNPAPRPGARTTPAYWWIIVGAILFSVCRLMWSPKRTLLPRRTAPGASSTSGTSAR